MTRIVHSFRAMNTEVQIVIDSGSEGEARTAARRVEAMFAETEHALSRFLPESELSALNLSAGRPFRASPLLLRTVAEALTAARETDGLFDPTVLNALLAAGYDRSFELLNDGTRYSEHQDGDLELLGVRAGDLCRRGGGPVGVSPCPSPSLPVSLSPRPAGSPLPRPSFCWRDVVVDRRSSTITLPPNTGLDLGGIGKGWTVDRAAEVLRRFDNFVVDAGGDIYAAGTQDDGAPWTVGVEDPTNRGRDVAVLAVRDRAVVTSTTSRRRWVLQGQERHHLIDPRTGHPAASGVASVTAIASSAARAETLAKAALLLGPREGILFLEERGVKGILVLDGGHLELTPSLQKELQHAS